MPSDPTTCAENAWPSVDVDLGDPATAADPYPVLAAMRSRGAVVQQRSTGALLVTTHAGVTGVLRDRSWGRVWADRTPLDRLAPFNALHRHQMMENEPPEHTRLRRSVAAAFGRGHVERLRPLVRSIASNLLAHAGSTFDVVRDYAEPLSVAVICELLGVPAADGEQLRAWSQAIVAMYEPAPSQAVESSAVRASADFAAYVADLLDRRAAEPRDDLVSDLVADEGLSRSELVASVVLLLNAGHEASVNGFGNAVHALSGHPEELAAVASGQVGIDVAWEELLRFDTPLQLFERTAVRDTKVVGHPVPAGTRVALLMGAANRDPAQFPEPDRLQLSRDSASHVSFGLGVHFCLGAPLARLELQVALRTLLDRAPRLQGVDGRRRPGFVLRGWRSLLVQLDP
jgi:cytochrome P450